jgi:hypothetical protein
MTFGFHISDSASQSKVLVARAYWPSLTLVSSPDVVLIILGHRLVSRQSLLSRRLVTSLDHSIVPHNAFAAASPSTSVGAYTERLVCAIPDSSQSRIGSPETEFPSMSVVLEKETTRLPVRLSLFEQRTGGMVVK